MKKPDLVIGTSPQLLVGLSAWAIARTKRVPFVFEVRDIWPDAILASGVGRQDSLFAKTLTSVSRFLHSRCDLLVAVTPAFVEELASQWKVPREKMAVVMNGVEEDLFSPEGSRSSRTDLGLDDRFLISYIGTVGQAHGLAMILDTARLLSRSLPQATFIIVGEGAERASLQERAKREGLQNVRFLGQVPRLQIPDLIRSSDVCLVLLKDAPIFRTVIPTKMLEYMSCSRPILIGVDGQARSIVEQAEAGLFVSPEDASVLGLRIEKLYREPELRERMGINGRRYVLDHQTRKLTAESYLALLQGLV